MSESDVDSRPARSLRNGISSSLPSVALSNKHIMEAIARSSDNGATLDLAHKDLTDVGESGVEELATVCRDAKGECGVIRIALAYNRLTTLPMALSLLSRLRYLVLRNNNFSVFPDVLTVMPSLEILDISRNKIKRLPSQPGSLTNLRVFSIVRNKIHKLPPYISQFRELTLLKVDQNPWEWPPKHVLQPDENLNDPDRMKEWIRRVQTWIEENIEPPTQRKTSEDSIGGVIERDEIGPDLSEAAQSVAQTSSSKDEIANSPYHARSYSVESDSSIYSRLECSSTEPEQDRPRFPRFLQGSSKSHSRSVSHSPDSCYPLDEIMESTHEDSPIALRGRQGRAGNDLTGTDSKTSSSYSNVTVRNSFSELRPLKLQSKSDVILPQRPVALLEPTGSARRKASASTDDLPASSPIAEVAAAPSMDKERHSYFRRFSALTPLHLSKAIPEDLLALVDAARGILFGVSRIYETLQLYTHTEYAIDQRLSTVLNKVLDPASVYMTGLINALDRFDTMSVKGLPPPSVCRAVVECCRDNVAVFGKAVGVLALQLKVLATHDDVRYTRQMLLNLYGSMAEIASSWQAMAMRIEAVKPLLWEIRPPPAAKSHAAQSPSSARSAAAHIADSSTSDQPRLRHGVSPTSRDHGQTRMARRHAGSFSYKDVEIGKMLPSFVDAPSSPLTAGVINGAAPSTPVLRSARRMATALGSTPLGTPNGDSAVPTAYRWDSHSRQGSQNSLPPSSSGLALRTAQVETPSNTSTLVDKEAIDAVKKALDLAPAIWNMMDRILNDREGVTEDVKEIVDQAKVVTERLRRNIGYIRDGVQPTDKPLHDEARTFAKTVIQLSSAIKTHMTSHPLSSDLRTSMVNLTNATEEFVILLHVSSFSPAPTPRPYSPMVAQGAIGTPEESKLGAGLSRSRSALPSASSKLASSLPQPPHSALPHQSFSIPNPPRSAPFRREFINQSAAVLS
ncbi:uncharacterized protein LAESUDRAFT_747064 [Laetiporus sulphureus 93-53]|uniref:Uncharacterized protein n=1 Tax=Laetiporus sulphureus 93-53 TaxID=1314785 RepID=A0A165H6I5_9APHY|nr:uncharacterized protein LAESUDRAFT_747064 [Laetiporus sulphureus 93-53]KZT11311.1 hypothetical protein LAESUDRAFT_747064 [Laetiporus sulphureus 93-53]